jgi:predicted transposase/invertase (TIGR01784 family)
MKYVTAIERMAEARGEERARAQERREIALNMLKDNLPLEQILRLTGLTSEQLQQLQIQTNQ